MDSKRISRLFSRAALLAASLTVSLISAELIVRALAPQQLIYLRRTHIWQPDAVYGKRMRPNLDTVVNVGEGPVRIVTDSEGVRVSPKHRSTIPPGETFPILTIGDSFLAATAVDYDSTIPSLLEQQLGQRLGKMVTVRNVATGGWNPNHYRLVAQNDLKRRSYRLGIVFLYVANDVVKKEVSSFRPVKIIDKHSFRFPGRLAWSAWVKSLLYPLNDVLEESSHLAVLLKNRGHLLRARVRLTAEYFPKVLLLSSIESAGWDVTTSICKSIANEFQAHSTPVTFILLPAHYQVHDDTLWEYADAFGMDRKAIDLELPNRLLHERFERESLTLLDPLPAMKEIADRGTKLYGSVHRHFNANGHRAVVDFIIDPIVQLLNKGNSSAAR